MLQRLIYLSSATGSLSHQDLGRILTRARRNNQRDEITGLLMYHDGTFFQILEGAGDMVRATYARIAANPGHRSLQKLPALAVESRLFPNWSMAFARPENVIADPELGVTAFRAVQRDLERIQAQDRRAAAMMRVFFSSFRDILPTVQA